VYDSPNSSYKNSPNRGDVEGYDTKQGVKDLLKAQKAREKASNRGTYNKDGEYEPTGTERTRMVKEFHKLTPMEQHKDLLTTHNVVRNEKQREGWLQNPRAYDVRGIDTQPKELMEHRVKTVQKESDNIIIVKNTSTSHGMLHLTTDPKNLGEVWYNPNAFDDHFNYIGIVSHEFGHKRDRMRVIHQMNKSRLSTRDKIYNLQRKYDAHESTYMREAFASTPARFNNPMAKSLINFNLKHVFPSTHPLYEKEYRERDSETMADWFEGTLRNKRASKRETRLFYNIFRNKNKPLFKALRKSDQMVTRKYMSGNL
jgi:hypothetical protein